MNASLNILQNAASLSTANHSTRNSWLKWSLAGAALWNIFGGVSALLDPTLHFTQMYSGALSLEDPLQLYFYRCVWINVIAWGIGYIIAAFVPSTRRSILAAGGIGKLFYCLACVSLVFAGVGKGMLLFAGIVDLLLGVLFAVALMAERKPLA